MTTYAEKICPESCEMIRKMEKENKEMKKEIFEFDPLTGGLSRKKKLDVANKKLLDFYQTMTEDQQQNLAAYKNSVDGSPIDHQDIIAWMGKLLKERDEFEEENDEIHAEWQEKDDEIKKLKEENAELKLKLEQELAFGSGYNGLRARIAKLKEENETLQRRATMYEYMSEFMEKSDTFSAYFDYIREYYPDERKEAGDLVSSDEEDENEPAKKDWYNGVPINK